MRIPLFRALFRSFLIAVPLLSVAPAEAKPPPGPIPGEGAIEESLPLSLPDPLVRKAQDILGRMGRYKGPVDGRMNPDLDKAIRIYQRSAGFKSDGRVTDELIDHLETGGKVEKLLKRLEETRQKERASARAALLGRAETRNLIIGSVPKKAKTADPTRDPEPCFQTPTAVCLLAEASESAKAVHKPEMRDWVLGELLVAQTKAGLTRQAMATVSRIHDPRLIMVALRNIAEAQAQAGRERDAIAASEIIPDALKQAEALAAIALILTRRGDAIGAGNVTQRLIGVLDRVQSRFERISFYARAAVAMMQAGAAKASARNLALAKDIARTLEDEAQKETGFRQIAVALAEMGRPDEALDLLEAEGGKTERTPVLVTTAITQAKAGATGRALETAGGIEAKRYRAVVLTKIAGAQIQSNDRAGARKTIELAQKAAEDIKLPFARSFALSRIARTLSDLEAGTAPTIAPTIAQGIKDDRLRAHTLWTVAARQRRSGNVEAAAKTEAMAEKATGEIKSTLGRMWMFTELSLSHRQAGEHEAAWEDFQRALKIAKGIHNAWSRARALGQLAAILVELNAPNAKAASPGP